MMLTHRILLLSLAIGHALVAPSIRRVGATRRASDATDDGAPSDTGDDVAEAPDDPAERAALKSKLFAACAAADRGYRIRVLPTPSTRVEEASHRFAASPADREAIEEALLELEPLSPTEEPTRGLTDGAYDAPLRACWRLVYTSASDVSTLAANPLVSLGGIYQDARDLPVVVNAIAGVAVLPRRASRGGLQVIDQFPRALANLPPSLGSSLATSTRLRVQTRARPRSASRVGLTFERIGVEQTALLGQAVPDRVRIN